MVVIYKSKGDGVGNTSMPSYTRGGSKKCQENTLTQNEIESYGTMRRQDRAIEGESRFYASGN